jgi:hypothetical protein
VVANIEQAVAQITIRLRVVDQLADLPSAASLTPGSRLVARFERSARRRATVAWQKGEEIGCSFERPLGEKQLAALAGL